MLICQLSSMIMFTLDVSMKKTDIHSVKYESAERPNGVLQQIELYTSRAPPGHGLHL